MEQKKLTVRSCGIIFFILLVVIDRVTKIIAERHLNGNEPIVLINNVFQLNYLENRGAAFGILQGQRTIFIIFTVIILVVIWYCYWRAPYEKKFVRLRIILILIASGAVGNFIDRMFNGYVVDFFYFNLINFPIFNVADIYVTCAAIFLVLLVLFGTKDQDWNELIKSLGLSKRKA